MNKPRLVVIDHLPDGTSAPLEDKKVTPCWKTEDGHETAELFYLNTLPPHSPFKQSIQNKFNFNLLPGELRFGHSIFPPFSEVKKCYKKYGVMVEEKNYGKHNTPTIDFLVLIKGRLDLMTDHGTVHLNPGDCIVQKATVHAWVNPHDEIAELVYVMTGANVSDEFIPMQPKSPVKTFIEYPPIDNKQGGRQNN